MTLGLLAVAFLLTGCPRDMCILQICENGKCRCSWSTCPDGASFDVNTKRCACDPGRVSLDGQCLTMQAANAYCGRGFRYDGRGCVMVQCPAGNEMDYATGQCIPQQRVNEVAANMGVQVGAGEKLGCPAGTKLVIDGNAAACVPLSQTCAPDETWNGQACVKAAQCPTGSALDPATGQCVNYAASSDSEELSVDVLQWAQANYGPNGGNGTPKFCGQFARKPWSFGVTEGTTAAIQISIALTFPDAQIQAGQVRSAANFAASGNAVPQRGATAVQEAAQSLLTTLQLGGGKANQPAVNTSVRCYVVNAAKPAPIPATGGV
jgi:hypothetical protein